MPRPDRHLPWGFVRVGDHRPAISNSVVIHGVCDLVTGNEPLFDALSPGVVLSLFPMFEFQAYESFAVRLKDEHGQNINPTHLFLQLEQSIPSQL